jgi:hypothetical protein
MPRSKDFFVVGLLSGAYRFKLCWTLWTQFIILFTYDSKLKIFPSIPSKNILPVQIRLICVCPFGIIRVPFFLKSNKGNTNLNNDCCHKFYHFLTFYQVKIFFHK